VLAQVLLRTQRYDEAETWGRRARANASDDRVRTQTDQFLNALAQARDYDLGVRERREAAVPAGATTSVTQSGEASAQRVPNTESQGGVPDLERRAPANSVESIVHRMEGVVTQVRCNGDAMEITLKVEAGPIPLLFRAKDRNRIAYTSDVPSVRSDIEPCTELKGHRARIVFNGVESNEFLGEVVRIEVTK